MAHTPRPEDEQCPDPPVCPSEDLPAEPRVDHSTESVHAVEPPETARTERMEGALTGALRPAPVVPRWIGWLVIGVGLLMLPWVAGLVFILPTRHEAAHYGASWIGFDLALCAMLIRTGWLAQKGREHIELSAAMTGTLLLVDAWFDVVTADSHRELAIALLLAFCAELPLAAFCLWIAGRVEFRRQRRAEAMSRLVRQWSARLSSERRTPPVEEPER
ncbi:hypothetical protein [Actinoallomurus iriomotensis]|uniref:Uncharacterized protein n=1 Tax=Actinoallomurus iriomotensis TaxID=478107 RepID=A0A9W6RNS9_9ACTN|nr:hypothetical protein [Actinoallomurus iriomotensis]GLY79048.1 hypothetical protein Airi01_073150 [Actinoallomurus iriomotensis]